MDAQVESQRSGLLLKTTAAKVGENADCASFSMSGRPFECFFFLAKDSLNSNTTRNTTSWYVTPRELHRPILSPCFSGSEKRKPCRADDHCFPARTEGMGDTDLKWGRICSFRTEWCQGEDGGVEVGGRSAQDGEEIRLHASTLVSNTNSRFVVVSYCIVLRFESYSPCQD